MDVNYCCGKAHKGIAGMAENIWNESGDKIINLFNENETIKDYTFVITGHSLGAGTASLMFLNVRQGSFGKATRQSNNQVFCLRTPSIILH
jgi:hypothetical protein